MSWSKEELDVLKKLVGVYTNEEIASCLPYRTEYAVRGKMSELKIGVIKGTVDIQRYADMLKVVEG